MASSAAEVATWVLKDYVKKFQLRNPQLYVIGAYIHLDEETPHLHLNFVPWVSGCKRGLETKTSLKAALATRGFACEGKGNTEWKQWAEAEKYDIALIMHRYGIDWKKKNTHNPHLSVLDYKKQEWVKEVAALEEELESAQVVLELKEEIRAIEICEAEKKYNNSAERIALYVINSGRKITNLLLQKILYYVKVVSKIVVGDSIILEPCEAWKFGPVFPSVYEKYRDFGKREIEVDLSDEYVNGLLTDKEKQIVDYVMNTFGIYNAWFLKDLMHLEEPWIAARKGLTEDDASRNLMDEEIISSYFSKVNEKYNLKKATGIEAYINHIRKEM